MRVEKSRYRTATAGRIAAAALLIAVWVGGVLSIATNSYVAQGQDRVQDVASDVRISAQRLEYGDVRFGLRVRDASGGWAAPVSPRAHRFDPGNVRVGRWLVSSPLVLEVDDAGLRRLVPSHRFGPASASDVALVTGLDEWASDAHYSAFHDETGDLVTKVSIYSASVGAPDGELRTTITCQDGQTSVVISGLTSGFTDSSANQQVDVTWSLDDGARRSGRGAVESTGAGLELALQAGSKLTEALLEYGRQLTLSVGTAPALTTTIDLEAFRALPAYNNLRFCSGEAGPSGHTELRIRAQVRADRRIEFALQQRTADGWSDNILPRARVMPASGDATRWLSSTPVSVNVELEPGVEISLPEPVIRQDAEPIAPAIRSGWHSGSLSYEVDHEDLEGYWPTSLNSVLTVSSDQGLQLRVGCFGDERQVLLAGAPSDASGDLLLAVDDNETSVIWSVSSVDGTSTLRPVDSERAINRLRQASTLSVSLGHDESALNSFNLAYLFTTPIQANIDHCGNYAEPDWRPITDAPRVEQELGAYYGVLYREWNGFLRDSHVKTIAIDSAPAAPGGPFTLLMTCNSQILTFQIERLPDVGNPTSIRLRLDGGDPFEVPVSVFDVWDGTTLVAFNPDLDALRQGTTLQFEIGTDRQARGTFSLTELFGTPLQTNFDNCARDYWSSLSTYVPVVAPNGRLSRTLSYEAYHDEDSTVSTGVWSTAVDAPEIDGEIEMQATCYLSTVLQILIGVPLDLESEYVSVTVTVDGRSLGTTSWHVQRIGTGSLLRPPSPRLTMAQLRGSSVAVMEIPELSPVPITFDLSGMFDTPVQANLDECGYYKPGEVRTRPLALNVFGARSAPGSDGNPMAIRFWQRLPGDPTIVETTMLEYHLRDGRVFVGLSMTCGAHAPSLHVFGDRARAIVSDRVQVEWRTDGEAVQRATWSVFPGRNSTAISPLRAHDVIASWRSASELEITLLDARPSSHRFNLEAIFDNPVVKTFDECLTMLVPPQSVPVTGIPLSFDANLTFAADALYGSSWVSSFVTLRESSDTQAPGVEHDRRSTLRISCAIDGLSVGIGDLDGLQPATIYGSKVEVAWDIDGRTHTELWDAWTSFYQYDTSPPDDLEFYRALKGAATLTIRVASDPVTAKTYELERHGFWDTPVQPNLDACGSGEAPSGDRRPPSARELSQSNPSR